MLFVKVADDHEPLPLLETITVRRLTWTNEMAELDAAWLDMLHY